MDFETWFAAKLREKEEAGLMTTPLLSMKEPLRSAWKAALEAVVARGPDAMSFGWDGYGFSYIDNGSGSDWQTRHEDSEPLYTKTKIMECL